MLVMRNLGGFSAEFRFNTFAIAAFMSATSAIATMIVVGIGVGVIGIDGCAAIVCIRLDFVMLDRIRCTNACLM